MLTTGSQDWLVPLMGWGRYMEARWQGAQESCSGFNDYRTTMVIFLILSSSQMKMQPLKLYTSSLAHRTEAVTVGKSQVESPRTVLHPKSRVTQQLYHVIVQGVGLYHLAWSTQMAPRQGEPCIILDCKQNGSVLAAQPDVASLPLSKVIDLATP